MKKILGIIALFSVLVLIACDGDNGGSSTIVCRMEHEGVDTETTIYVEDGYAIRTVMEVREYADGVTEDELDLLRDLMGDGVELELDGEYVIITYATDLIEEVGEAAPIDEMIEDLEAQGFDCD